ncbi:MAG: chemotaxis protein CheX [Wolinella sp.]
MVEVLQRAFMKSIYEMLGEIPELSDRAMSDGYISSIEIISQGEHIPVYLIIRPLLLQALAERLLGEMQPDERTMIDIASELSNLVVGVAKVIGSEENKKFSISTPKFLKIGHLEPSNEAAIHFKTSHSFCSLYIGNTRG